MRLEELTEAQKFTNQKDWVAAMKEAGAEEFVKEVVSEKEREAGYRVSTDLIYALAAGKTKLLGTWSKQRDGEKFSKPMSFDKRRRKFSKEKL